MSQALLISSNLQPGQTVGFVDTFVCGILRGKVKGQEIYLVRSSNFDNVCKSRYGEPNRHLELEWGQFNGTEYEFLVPLEDLR